MPIEKTGAMISRAAGIVLVVIGGSGFLSWPWFEPSGLTTSGWTSYSPVATNAIDNAMTHLHDTYYAVSNIGGFYLPSAAQVLAGLVMIVLSRPIGRWLARGLEGNEK